MSQLPSVGYKYICWDLAEDNAEAYMSAAKKRVQIGHEGLTECKGMYDKENMPGIYFCQSLNDLHVWVKELFDFAEPSAIELLEITPMGQVQERHYEDGRIAYVVEKCTCRVLHDREIPADFMRTIREYFDK